MKRPDSVDVLVPARRKSPQQIAKEVSAAYQVASSTSLLRRKFRLCTIYEPTSLTETGRLILIDSLNPLINSKTVDSQFNLPAFLSSFLIPTSPSSPKVETSLVATYHQDVSISSNQQLYAPSPLSLLSYLATTVIKLHSFSHILAQKAARDRSLAAPVFGLEEEQDGVLLGRLDKLVGNENAEGIILEMEHRRKSGRGVLEWYILPPASRYPPNQTKEIVTLLDDHPLYCPPEEPDTSAGDEEPESTFNLRLTDRQRREREGVVLPYFDAQSGEGPGEGGRILYDMGEEDDFDEEEDEI